MQKIKVLTGSPVLSWFPFEFIYLIDDVLYFGTAVPSESEIVVKDGYAEVVFTGDFDVSGGDVTGGTMTGFAVWIGKTEVLEAKGYSVPGAELYDAIETYDTDWEPFDDLIAGAATKFVGSKYGDLLADWETGETDDTILGRAADDTLFGHGGDDTLKGGKGNDWLQDFAGTNKLFGGPGSDTFAFGLYSGNPDVPVSKIKDFVKGEDVINLTADIMDLPFGGLQRKFFHKGDSAEGPDDYVIYQKSKGKIFIDYDGSDTGEQVHFATVTPGTKLQSHDFVVGLGFV